MTLFFNLHILESSTGGDSRYLVTALEKAYYGRTIPKTRWEKYKPLPNLIPGSSFLLNPSGFFKDVTVDPIWRAQYIKLAGRRDYQMYKVYKQKYLDLSYYPDIAFDFIKGNPLLRIADNRLFFKHEESKWL